MTRAFYQLPKLLTTSLRGDAADVSPMWRDAAENPVGQAVMPYRVKMGERCRAVTLLGRVKTVQREPFFAIQAQAVMTYPLDIIQERG